MELDYESHRKLLSLVESSTRSTGMRIEHAAVCQLKSLCRASPQNLRAAFEILRTKLRAPHPQTRALALLLVDLLFCRSADFRRWTIDFLTELIDLTIAPRAGDSIPAPVATREYLKERALEVLDGWDAQFGALYKVLRLSVRYLRDTAGLPVPDRRAAEERRRKREATRRVAEQKIHRANFENILKDFPKVSKSLKKLIERTERCFDELAAGFYSEMFNNEGITHNSSHTIPLETQNQYTEVTSENPPTEVAVETNQIPVAIDGNLIPVTVEGNRIPVGVEGLSESESDAESDSGILWDGPESGSSNAEIPKSIPESDSKRCLEPVPDTGDAQQPKRRRLDDEEYVKHGKREASDMPPELPNLPTINAVRTVDDTIRSHGLGTRSYRLAIAIPAGLSTSHCDRALLGKLRARVGRLNTRAHPLLEGWWDTLRHLEADGEDEKRNSSSMLRDVLDFRSKLRAISERCNLLGVQIEKAKHTPPVSSSQPDPDSTSSARSLSSLTQSALLAMSARTRLKAQRRSQTGVHGRLGARMRKLKRKKAVRAVPKVDI
eukprot:201031_1